MRSPSSRDSTAHPFPSTLSLFRGQAAGDEGDDDLAKAIALSLGGDIPANPVMPPEPAPDAAVTRVQVRIPAAGAAFAGKRVVRKFDQTDPSKYLFDLVDFILMEAMGEIPSYSLVFANTPIQRTDLAGGGTMIDGGFVPSASFNVRFA